VLKEVERWIGPFQIRNLLETAANPNAILPPERGSAYLVTERAWRSDPTSESGPLYVGGITGKSDHFRTRIGDLLADSFGFYGKLNGHSSGGTSIHKWCVKNGVRPLDLHLSWVEGTGCHRCLEVRASPRSQSQSTEPVRRASQTRLVMISKGGAVVTMKEAAN
jgi:hypothetical protein